MYQVMTLKKMTQMTTQIRGLYYLLVYRFFSDFNSDTEPGTISTIAFNIITALQQPNHKKFK